jgi:DedD protein
VNDEGFREIQLSGKQLVFLFMAATVVSVVIFLCGVLVGRGVRPTGSTTEMSSSDIGPDRTAPETAAPSAASVPSAAVTAGSTASPAAEELSYAERLLRDTPPQEKLEATPMRPGTPRPLPTPPPAVQDPVAAERPPLKKPAPAVSAVSAEKSAAALTPSNPSGPGFAVQVAAYRDRREADTLAKQLIAKGYPAFVMDPVKGAPTALFRVRVGKYKTLKDAEEVSARLQSAEHFNTAWIAR